MAIVVAHQYKFCQRFAIVRLRKTLLYRLCEYGKDQSPLKWIRTRNILLNICHDAILESVQRKVFQDRKKSYTGYWKFVHKIPKGESILQRRLYMDCIGNTHWPNSDCNIRWQHVQCGTIKPFRLGMDIAGNLTRTDYTGYNQVHPEHSPAKINIPPETNSADWENFPNRLNSLQESHCARVCLVPYDELPEIEKEYDRDTAMGTLRLIRKLGFKIIKE